MDSSSRVLDEEMRDLYIYTLFESGGRPRCTGVKAGDTIQIYELFRPGARKTISTINQHKALIRDLILKAHRKCRVIISDFKSHIAAFNLPLELREYNVYDVHLPDFLPSDSSTKDVEIIKKVLHKMSNSRIKDYQKVFANAAVVYQDLQNRGLLNNYTEVSPIWSQKTFSGRSKTTGFNIQGFTEPHKVLPPGANERSVLIHFDWICADIRAASLLSGDNRLQDSFVDSDPYTYMMNIINRDAPKPITRSECKIFLLKSINSMDFSSIALTKIYRTLGEWIARSSKITRQPGGYLETLLGRRFRRVHARNELAVLNGAMQGSVAHGMQNVVRRVWEKLGHKIVTEIHDSLIVSSPPENNEIKATISAVAKIMLYPFEGLLSENPAFPLKVSIGKKWRQWKLFATYRQSGIEYAKAREEAETGEDPPEGETEEGSSQEGTS